MKPTMKPRITRTRVIHLLLLPICMAALAGCATKWERQDPPATDSAGKREEVGDVMQSPMRDLNLLQEKIPAVLNRAVATPYVAPEPMDCMAIADEIRALDAVLGEDIDNTSLGADKENLALRAFASGIHSLMPYRSLLRRISGAEKRERRALEAIAAGSIRRGYLKGRGEAEHCAPPASPRRD